MKHVRVVVATFDPDDEHVSPEVADKELTCAVLSGLENVVTDMAVKGWDAPPLLGPLYLRGRTPVGEMQGWAGSVLEWRPLPAATPPLSKAKRQHHVLLHLAEAYQQSIVPVLGGSLMPEDMIAMVLINEAWMVLTDLLDETAMAEVTATADRRELHTHPRRIEAKQAVAVDINGTVYHVVKMRGEKTTHRAGPALSKYAIAGDIPNALEYLLLSFQGKTLPDWEAWWQTNRDYRDLAEKFRQEPE